MASPDLSIVVPVHNEGPWLHLTIEAILASTSIPFEVVVVDDGSTDGCCDILRRGPSCFENVRLITQRRSGIATARNRGADEARAPVLAFLDAHCFPRRDWAAPLLETLATNEEALLAPCVSAAGDGGSRGYGMTLVDRSLAYEWLGQETSAPYEVPIACGCCLASTRRSFDELGRFDAFRTFGFEDVELSLRWWLFGRRVLVVPESEVAHVFKESTSFEVDRDDYDYNLLRTAVLHFDGARLGRILDALRVRREPSDVIEHLLQSDIRDRYSFVRSRRVRDADWFCTRFAIDV